MAEISSRPVLESDQQCVQRDIKLLTACQSNCSGLPATLWICSKTSLKGRVSSTGIPRSRGVNLGTGPINHLSIELTTSPDIKYALTSRISWRGIACDSFVGLALVISARVLNKVITINWGQNLPNLSQEINSLNRVNSLRAVTDSQDAHMTPLVAKSNILEI